MAKTADRPSFDRGLNSSLLGLYYCIDGLLTSIIHLATQQGLTTAAAAYSWFSELYNRAPFDRLCDRQQSDPRLPIVSVILSRPGYTRKCCQNWRSLRCSASDWACRSLPLCDRSKCRGSHTAFYSPQKPTRFILPYQPSR